ncbi:MAG: transposase [Actinobacteria bacterium]|nr:transposase [Actinomycetota bacterium]
MQGKKEFNQRIYYDFNLESMVPDYHLLKRINKIISFEFVRDKTKSYYSHTGKPSIDPVVLVKCLLIGYLFDIRSERKLVEEISLNLAYRWYIGYDLDETIPDHSIFSKARARFGKKLFCQIFEEILKTATSLNLVSKDTLLIDSTIVKANASKLRSVVIEGVIGNAKAYHGLQRAKLRGKEKVQMQFLLTASAMNLKKMVNMLEIYKLKQSISGTISRAYEFIKNILENRLNILIFTEA